MIDFSDIYSVLVGDTWITGIQKCTLVVHDDIKYLDIISNGSNNHVVRAYLVKLDNISAFYNGQR